MFRSTEKRLATRRGLPPARRPRADTTLPFIIIVTRPPRVHGFRRWSTDGAPNWLRSGTAVRTSLASFGDRSGALIGFVRGPASGHELASFGDRPGSPIGFVREGRLCDIIDISLFYK